MEVVIIFVLILVNGLFSMAEIALVSARKIRLEQAANKGDEGAKKALELANNPDTLLSTVQIGITLIGILTGVYSGETIKGEVAAFIQKWPLLQPYSSSIATFIVVIIITYFTLVLGELVPKRMGLARPEAIAKVMAGPMVWLSKITFPFIWLLSISSNLMVRLFNIKTATDSQVTEEEIKAMINEGTHSGAIEETEQAIIERVFHLGDRNITSLMTHRSDIVWVDMNEQPSQFKEKMAHELHSAYPVCDGQIDNIRGIIYVKDLYLADEQTDIQSLIKTPLFLPENNTAYQVLEKFKKSKLHHGFIVDEYGTLLGMITLNDILEAIVGDMPQSEQKDYEVVKRADGTYLVDAQIPFYDFLVYFDKAEWISDIEQEFDTLAGFILHHLEHIPQTGEKFEWRGFTFEIVDMDIHRIDKVLVQTAEQPKTEE